MPEQGASRLTVYTCPSCGSDSLEAHPCFYDQHDGRNHGRVEREPVEYVRRGSEVKAFPARLHGLPDPDSLLEADDNERTS